MDVQAAFKYYVIGSTVGMAGFLATKLLYSQSGNQFFTDTEMRMFFIITGVNAFAIWFLWDKIIIENDKTFWKSSNKTTLLLASLAYAACAINPAKLKYVIGLCALLKIGGFKLWFDEPDKFGKTQALALIGDLVGGIGFSMAFLQLNSQK